MLGVTIVNKVTTTSPGDTATEVIAAIGLALATASRSPRPPSTITWRALTGSTASQDTISLILTLTGQNRARTQQLRNREHRLRVGSRAAYWYRTPLRLTRPEQAGTLSVLKGDTLVLIAVGNRPIRRQRLGRRWTAILPRLWGDPPRQPPSRQRTGAPIR